MKMLLCTDASSHAAEAARFGLRLVRRGRDLVQLLGVMEYDEGTERSIRNALAALETELHAMGVMFETKERRGHAAEQIIAEAAEWQADLIVIGQLGRRGLTRFMLGSTATHVVQYAHCSVLLVKGQRTDLQRILVCTAGGEPGLRDVKVAGQLAALRQAAVTVLHVMSQVALTEKDYRPELEATADDLIARRAPEGVHLETALNTLKSLEVSGAAKVRHGLVVDEIVAEAREGNYDLLVIGAHLAHGLSRWLLDDVTAHVLDETQVSVLVVHGQL